jgi:peroxidase
MGQLVMGYYSMSCPYAEAIVRNVVGEALYKDPTLAASLLRLHFHDCFVRGCDASVLIDSTDDSTAEKDALPNKSLRGFEVIDAVKEALEAHCPGTVSCADVLALAARDSVSMAGGPYYDVPTGRRDGFRSVSADTSALPAATLTAPQLIDVFVGTHGFTVPELVALSGGHTLGQAHCANFKNRLKANAVDPTLEAGMAASLIRTCRSGGDGATAKLDMTSNAFDTQYFRGLQRSRGLLTSDQTLVTGSEETAMYVSMFAENSDMFFETFVQGMAKMGQLDLNPYGDVRMNCRVLNN